MQTGKSTVELIDHMGSDLSVVNAARVSFGKRKETFTVSDVGLIKYLAEHNHWSPFGHASMQFHIKAPADAERRYYLDSNQLLFHNHL